MVDFNTKYEMLEGMFNWMKYLHLNKYGNWSVQFYPKPPSLDKINEWIKEGAKNQLKKDDDGYYTTFTRRPSKYVVTPPEVIDKDRKPIPIGVGNGSTGILKIEKYWYNIGGVPGAGKAPGLRWTGAKVLELVPWDPNKDYEKDGPEERAVRGLPERTEVEVW